MTTQPITDIPTLLKWADTKRHHLGITYADLAERLKVSTSTVSYWFALKRQIPPDKLLDLLGILETALILVNKTGPAETGGQRT